MTYRRAMMEAMNRLTEAGIEDAASDSRLLMEYACQISRTFYFVHMMDEMPSDQESAFAEAVRLRCGRIPLQQITGSQEFMGLPFYVNEHVLCPRQDTETLVEEAMKYMTHPMRILDMCTGSGCILISLMHDHPDVTGVGADLSGEALQVASRNCEALQVSPELIHTDLFEKITGTFDMIVSNPPYIPTADIEALMPEVRVHEPRMALDGREDGLFFYRRIIREAGAFLNPGGVLLLEIGYNQGKDVSDMLKMAGFLKVRVVKDLAQNDRVAVGEL